LANGETTPLLLEGIKMGDSALGLGGEIALCLSGGGYRAAAFHLGVLDLLHRVDLLDKVRTLSTISGGTIIGTAWALSRAKGEAFETFFARMRKTLATRNVVREAVSRLDAEAAAPSLIRAAAAVYAEPEFLGTHTLDDLRIQRGAGADTEPDASSPEPRSRPPGPDDVVFSATEFLSGRAFRFQLSRRSQAPTGAPKLIVPVSVVPAIRLADVAAASSCFPGAFEPMAFPRDFTFADRDAVHFALPADFPDVVPLMDGGIFDNQGVDGALRVYERKGNEGKLGLLLVSDSSQRIGEIYTEPRPALPRWSLRACLAAVWLGALLSLGSALALSWRLCAALASDPWRWGSLPGLLLGDAFPALLTFAVGLLALWLLSGLKTLRGRLATLTGVELTPHLGRLTLRGLGSLLARRCTSLLAMMSDVSMKRVRGQIQSLLLADTSPLRPFVVLNLLYDLDKDRRSLFASLPWLRPSDALRDLAVRAEAVPTTLWFETESQLADLVACGQATTCFNLLEHFRGRQPSALMTEPDAAPPFVGALRMLWDRLQNDPSVLLRDRGLAPPEPPTTTSSAAPHSRLWGV
jgi:predicted acylesterase/phospholipase RssA